MDPEEEKTKLRIQKLEFALLQFAHRLFKQMTRQDERQVLQDTEAVLLKEKREELEKVLQSQEEERKILDVKERNIEAAAKDLEAREAKMIKELEEVALGREEVSVGKVRVAAEQKRLAMEMSNVNNEKYAIFMERRVLQDLVKESELKKRSAAMPFLKALTGAVRHAATPVVEWLSLLALMVVVGGVVVSGKTPFEVFQLCLDMLLNEVNDRLQKSQDRVDRASKDDGNE
ncbi:hypothetical protein ACQ4PT_046523 [Festuca glaucescens]